ncbi:MAG TPA: hypothetical protein PKC65_13895 [Pyrinomonadaceae bacterium]|nr:hypothetical protein [Pyrinomonadaceae bacterium]
MKNRLVFVFIAVLVFAFLAVQNNAENARPTMTPPPAVWEYKLIARVMGNPTPTSVQLYEDGKLLPASVNLIAKVNELGSQGWEMFSVATESSLTYHWFKRQK